MYNPPPVENTESQGDRTESAGQHQKTLRGYRFYIGLNMIWYLLLGIGSIALIAAPFDSELFTESSIGLLRLGGRILLMISGFFALTTYWIRRPERSETGWSLAFANICLGISTVLLAPYCIWLALRWNDAQFKAWFIQP